MSEYQGEIKHWFLGETQNGTPFIQFNVLLDKELDDFGGEKSLEEFFTVPIPLYLSPAAREHTVTMLKYLGFTSTNPAHLDRKAKGYHNFEGLRVTVRSEIEEYMGKEREKWQFVRKLREASQEQKAGIFSSLADGFAEDMNRALGKVPESSDSDLETAGVSF